MADSNLAPSNTLTTPTPTLPNDVAKLLGDTPAPPKSKFILLGEQWTSLQNYITQGLDLPINQGDFDTKYGTGFSSKKTITDCLEGMKAVRGLSSTFGNPTILMKKIGESGYITSKEPPQEIYSHMVWLAMKIQGAASTFKFTLASLQPLLSIGTDQEKADNLKMILTGPGGLQSLAQEMVSRTQELIKKVSDFATKLADANTNIMQYAGTSSAMVKEVDNLIGTLAEMIKTTEEAAQASMKQWRDLTIAAVSVSIGATIIGAVVMVVVPFPLGVKIGAGIIAGGAAAGIGLGIAADKALKEYDRLKAEVETQGAQKALKTALKWDLAGLNTSVALVTPAMNTFQENLQTINGVWLNIQGQLSYIVNNYSVSQLSDYNWVQQAMQVTNAQNKWQTISETAGQFVQNSLVTYDIKKFGDPVEGLRIAQP